MMKVSVSFAPIHDIPMGLDSDGMMRSVAYNVGSASGLVGHDPLGPDNKFEAKEREKAVAKAAAKEAARKKSEMEESAKAAKAAAEAPKLP